MERKKIVSHIEKLEKAVSSHGDILCEYLEKEKTRLLGYIFPLVPPEITSAFGIETVKLPEDVISGEKKLTCGPLYKAVLLPASDVPCCMGDFSQIPACTINYPAGYGEDAAVALHNETASMLDSLFKIDIKSIDIPLLQKRTAVFEVLRRSIRSITALCQGRKELLTSKDLNLVFEAATIFPADIALPLIKPLLEELRNVKPEEHEAKARAMIYGARTIPAHIIECIESRGIAVVEDDTCCGRRLFDISLNAGSEYIFYELLDAYSYRPMSPCTRDTKERYELLYRLLRNYGINLLIFYRDDICGLSAEDISYLRIRMMRDGIDPLVIDSENYITEIESYAGRM